MKGKFDKSLNEQFKVFSRAFAYRNYRLYFCGQTLSVVGTWMQRIAVAWLIYRLTESELLLGVVAFASQIPNLLISPFVGVLADRCDRHKMLIFTQAFAMFQALVFAALVISGRIEVWHVVVLSVFLGIVFAFDLPVRQSFIHDMVEKKEDLSNAIALNSLLFNMARLIGPTIAGVIIATAGEGICFLINGLSYLSMIIALSLMKIKQNIVPSAGHSMRTEFIEGARYSFGFAPISSILQLLAIISLSSLSYIILMPVFASNVLGGDSKTLGFLMGAVGVGAVIGGVVFAMRKDVKGIGRHIAYSSLIFAIGVLLFATSRNLYLSMFYLMIVGFGQLNMFGASNTALQNITDDDKRGRVMAFYAVSILGITPFGSLIAGSIAELIGVQITLIMGAVISVWGVIMFYRKIPALRKEVRPIFIKAGIEYEPEE